MSGLDPIGIFLSWGMGGLRGQGWYWGLNPRNWKEAIKWIVLYGKGDTGLGKKLIHLAINSMTFKYQQEENILIKNIFEVLWFTFPLLQCLARGISINTNPTLLEGLWCGVWKGDEEECRNRNEKWLCRKTSPTAHFYFCEFLCGYKC